MVVTDLMCWIPLCIVLITVWHLPYEEELVVLGSSHEDHLTSFLWIETGILIAVCLNSLLNPYIYSWYLYQRLFEKIKSKFSTATTYVDSNTTGTA